MPLIGFSQQSTVFERIINRDSVILKIDTLKQYYGENKSYPPEFEHQFLCALSAYPELKNTCITIKYRYIFTTSRARPILTSLFSKNGKRQYYIFVNYNPKAKAPLIDMANFNEQIGLLGHELAHILDYEQKTFLQVCWLGAKYIVPKLKKQYEKETDFNTIERGLGWQLYDWASFVLNSPASKPHYKRYKSEYYLKPTEIENILALKYY